MRAAADAVVRAWMIQDLQMLGSSEGQQVLRFAVAVVRDRSLPEKNGLLAAAAPQDRAVPPWK